MRAYIVYVTTASREEAAAIGMTLVKEKLVACVNIWNSIESIYEWEGRIKTDSECVFITKTMKDRLPAVTERIRSLHSYECPCIVAVPIEQGNSVFLEWIQTQTREQAESIRH